MADASEVKDEPTKVYLAGLSAETDETALELEMSKHGQVAEVLLIKDKTTGRSRGFAFVTYENSADAALAVTGLNGKEFMGKVIKVDHAKKPSFQQPGYTPNRGRGRGDRGDRGGGFRGRGGGDRGAPRGMSRGMGGSGGYRGRGSYGGSYGGYGGSEGGGGGRGGSGYGGSGYGGYSGGRGSYNGRSEYGTGRSEYGRGASRGGRGASRGYGSDDGPPQKRMRSDGGGGGGGGRGYDDQAGYGDEHGYGESRSEYAPREPYRAPREYPPERESYSAREYTPRDYPPPASTREYAAPAPREYPPAPAAATDYSSAAGARRGYEDTSYATRDYSTPAAPATTAAPPPPREYGHGQETNSRETSAYSREYDYSAPSSRGYEGYPSTGTREYSDYGGASRSAAPARPADTYGANGRGRYDSYASRDPYAEEKVGYPPRESYGAEIAPSRAAPRPLDHSAAPPPTRGYERY